METQSIFGIIIYIFVGYLVIKFLWETFNTIIKLILIAVAIIVGVWLVKPSLIERTIGKDNMNQVEKKTQEKLKEGQIELEKTLKNL